MAEMETQTTGTEDGFIPVTHRGSRRAKKRHTEQSAAAGQDEAVGRMDTEEAQPPKRPVFPPLSGDQLLVGIRTGRDGRGPGVWVKGLPFPVFSSSLQSPPECVCFYCSLGKKKPGPSLSQLTDTHR